MRARARVFPHAERYAFAWTVTLGLVFGLAVVVAAPGCAVPAKAAEQLRIDTAAADGGLRLWPSLAPDQRLSHFAKLRQALWVLRYALLNELPDDTTTEIRVLIEVLNRGGK